MTTTTQGLVAITPGGDITDDMIAGSYTWSSIKEDMIPLRTVRKAFDDAGLDVSRLPTERRLEHVAQESVRRIEKVVQNGHREEVRVEHPIRDGDYLIMQVTRHVQDKERRITEHPKSLRVLFDFNTGSLIYEPLEGSTMADVQVLVDEINDNFDRNSTKIPGHKLRTILRHYLEAAGAENMRGNSGGVYFLAKTNKISASNKLRAHHGDVIDGIELLGQMQKALKLIYGPGAEFHIVPCVNDEGQREFLKRKFLENCAEDLKAYRNECLELAGADRVRAIRYDKRESMVQQRQEMDLRRQKFAEILGETLVELDRDMELADKALVKFLHEANA